MFKNVLLVECRDIPGLVHDITGVLFKHQLNITMNQEFVELDRFFMRTEFEGPKAGTPLIDELEAILPQGAIIRLGEQRPKDIVLLVSNESHCLGDILIRHEFKQLPVRILGV
ncbi:MAG: ACT domain-containing protein, partial [Gemmataceae bacterium]|nr:ACT domain-containing protein [Gemmataceae bacterium]